MTIDLEVYPYLAYLNYWLNKEDKYSLQGPFISGFYNELEDYLKKELQQPDPYIRERALLSADREQIQIVDYGAGSKKLKKKNRITSQIYKYSTTKRKFSTIYSFLIAQTPAEHVIELGTCLGINTLYLSQETNGKIYSFEGSPTLVKKARSLHQNPQIEYIEGEISDTLPLHLQTKGKVDFVLIDATHTKKATLRYFQTILPYLHEKSIVAIADIYWSREMTAAWKVILRTEEVSQSLDFYECGVLFFRKGITKSHFVLSV